MGRLGQYAMRLEKGMSPNTYMGGERYVRKRKKNGTKRKSMSCNSSDFEYVFFSSNL